MKEETWKPIPGLDGYYASNLGNIGSTRKGKHFRKLKTKMDKGSWYVTLHVDQKPYTKVVKYLVAKTYIPNPHNFYFVTCKKGNDTNPENLVWTPGPNGQGRKVYQYDDNGKLLNVYPCIREAAESVYVTGAAIGNCCNGVSESSAGYFWSYKSPEELRRDEN